MSLADAFEVGGSPVSTNSTTTDNILGENGTQPPSSSSSQSPANNDVDDTDDDDGVPVVQTIDDGVAYGFQCAQVVQKNTVTDIPLTFFLDISFPIGSEEVAIIYLQEQLIASVASYYGVSDGTRCANPFLSGSATWLVQILSKTTDWTRETIVDSCRTLNYDVSTHDCFVYRAVVTGSVLDGTMDDVMDFMELTLDDDALTGNSPFTALFLGPASTDPQVGDNTGRDNLGSPSSIAEADKAATPPKDRQTITIVGGLLVAAFGLAFIGVGMVMWRRRQEWIRRRDLQLDLDLNQDKNHPTHETGEDDDEYIGQEQLRQDLYDDEDVDDSHVELDSQGQVRTSRSNERREENNNERITFDLGTSFKDQLMGVYGGSSNKRNNQPQHRPPPSRLSSDGGAGLYPGRNGLNSDGASDISDADSWAQTDGTIGSLEHVNLEPITAEV